MGVHCEIILENNTIYSGGTLSGTVIYRFDSSEKFEDIKLIVRGKAYTSYHSGKTIIHMKDKFLTDEIVIFTSDENSAGVHSYPFNYVLPAVVPSSYSYNDSGNQIRSYIKYKIKTKRPTTFWTHTDAKEEFFVIRYLDLNSIPEAKNTAEANVSRDSFWLCCTSRPFFVSVHLSRKGFVSGTTIPYTLECNNQSKYAANDIVVSLRLIINYYRIKPDMPGGRILTGLKPSCIILAEMSVGAVNAREGKTWNKTLDIPKIQPLHTDGCKLLDIKYVVYIQVKFPFPHGKLTDLIPVTLGNVPICDEQPPDYSTSILPPHHYTFTVINDLKDLKRYKIKESAYNV